jgi:hypothetical protein
MIILIFLCLAVAKDSEYKQCRQPLTYYKALNTCKKWGGSLMHIQDAEEQDTLLKVKDDCIDPTWIGLAKY